ncbi:hypothetical protein RJ55_07101 [Drechmeria coniospora]|nr:hypothetical protein RJ55_07101 [Drechmeria coniospora]
MTVQSPYQRSTPFLHRTWLRGVKALQDSSVMGNIMTSPAHKGSYQGDGHGPRPTKRRRLSSSGSLDVDRLIASPQTTESGPILRIEVLKLLHKDSKKIKSYQATAMPRDVLTTKANCRITIQDMAQATPRVLHCQSQPCNLTTYKNPVGPHRLARVDLPHSFYVPKDSILVNRPDDNKHDLSDSYQLLVELETTDGLGWPPLDPHDLGVPTSAFHGRGTNQHCIFSSRFDSVIGRLKQGLSLSTSYPSDQSAHQTSYVMDVDLRWATGFKALKRPLDKDSKPCITAIDPDAIRCTGTSFDPVADHAATGHFGGDMSHENEVDLAGDQTPSRSLRIREKSKVYNLKVLSDQAQGRDRKKRERSASAAENEGRVQYLLPTDQPVCLDFHRCISCGAYHESMPQLQLHLQTFHPAYSYSLETTSQGPQFRVSSLRESFATPGKSQARQAKAFHLATVLPDDHLHHPANANRNLFGSPSARVHSVRLPSASPTPSGPRASTRRIARPIPRRPLVPNIPQPLFHPISKARLSPGQEVPCITPDDTWLIQKHRESIADFSDVTAAEKEYIWEWDGYILRKNVTSTAYFPRAWLGFVREKASWLVEEPRRMLEFGKHASVLLARDVLDNRIMDEALAFINAERASSHATLEEQSSGWTSFQGADGAVVKSPRPSQIRKGSNGCAVCQLPVRGPTTLVCSNKVRSPVGIYFRSGELLLTLPQSCLRRLHHSTCIENEAKMPATRYDWLCNACCDAAGSA